MWPYLLVKSTEHTPFRLNNIIEGNAIDIAITGMLIVFTALSLISLSIAVLPRLLEAVEKVFPTSEHRHAIGPADSMPVDEQRIVAAIGMVLHKEMQKMNKS